MYTQFPFCHIIQMNPKNSYKLSFSAEYIKRIYLAKIVNQTCLTSHYLNHMYIHLLKYNQAFICHNSHKKRLFKFMHQSSDCPLSISKLKQTKLNVHKFTDSGAYLYKIINYHVQVQCIKRARSSVYRGHKVWQGQEGTSEFATKQQTRKNRLSGIAVHAPSNRGSESSDHKMAD